MLPKKRFSSTNSNNNNIHSNKKSFGSQQQHLHANKTNFTTNENELKSSLYDWDSPSSFTGTVKRCPASKDYNNAATTTAAVTKINFQQQKNTPKNIQQQKTAPNRKFCSPPQQQQEIIISGNCNQQQLITCTNKSNKIIQKSSIMQNNLLNCQKHVDGGKLSSKSCVKSMDMRPSRIAKISHNKIPNVTVNNCKSSKIPAIEIPMDNNELDRKGGVHYHHQSPPAYRNPPTPPPISKIPSFFSRIVCDEESTKTIPNYIVNSSQSGNSMETNSETTTSITTNTTTTVTNPLATNNKLKSPYKAKVSELKNCISRGFSSLSSSNSSFSTSSSTSSSSSSSSSSSTLPSSVVTNTDKAIKLTSNKSKMNNENNDWTSLPRNFLKTHQNDYVLCTTMGTTVTTTITTTTTATTNTLKSSPLFKHFSKISPDDTLTKPKFTMSILKNLPVRQRKGSIPHLDNYCLFDPSIDFINEKDMKTSSSVVVATSKLSVDEKCLKFDTKLNEEFEIEFPITHDVIEENEDDNNAEEIMYTNWMSRVPTKIPNEIRMKFNQKDMSTNIDDNLQYHHHNYFTIDPEDEFVIDDDDDDDDVSERMTIIVTERDEKNQLNASGWLVGDYDGNIDDDNHKQKQQQNGLQFPKRLIDLSLPITASYSNSDNYMIQNELSKSRRVLMNSKISKFPLKDNAIMHTSILPINFDCVCDNNISEYVKIYTDWANCYLERAKSKRRLLDLSADCRDGVILADIIEAVTAFKVPELMKKPRTQQQMFDNVNACLILLRTNLVDGLDGITPNDICTGRLKAILTLFFALSKYKQQTKQQQRIGTLAKTTTNDSSTTVVTDSQRSLQIQQQHQQQQQLQQQDLQQNSTMVNINGNGEILTINRQIPLPYSKQQQNGTGCGTAIPLPATVLVQRRCPPDKVRPLPPTPNHVPSIPGLCKTTGNSGDEEKDCHQLRRDANSPIANNQHHHHHHHSNNTQLQSSPHKINNNGLRQPSHSRIPSSPNAVHPTTALITVQQQQTSPVKKMSPQQQTINLSNNSNGSATTCTPTAITTKHSMLDKLKLFNNKEKSPSSSSTSSSSSSSNTTKSSSSQISKRTSSSSGFSSARSERSDSNLSLNDGNGTSTTQIKTVTATVTRPKIDNSKNTKSKLFPVSTMTLKNQSKDKKEKKEPVIDPIDTQKTTKSSQKTTTIASSASKTNEPKLKTSKLSLTSINKTGIKSATATTAQMKPTVPLQTSPTPPVSNVTGIPKPMAAVKGTSKITVNLDKTQSESNQLKKPQQQQDENCISNNNENNISISNINGNSNQGHHIVSKIGAGDCNSSTTTTKATTTTTIFGNGQSIITNRNHNGSISIGDSIHSSTSAFYRPNSSTTTLPPPKPIAYLNAPQNHPTMLMRPQEEQSNLELIHPQNGVNNKKYNTVPNKIISTIYEEDQTASKMSTNSGGLQPMQPLLRGYNSHVTLPTRSIRSGQSYVTEFCESDIGQGYYSDNDTLRQLTSPSHKRFIEIDNGYLSEGGGIGDVAGVGNVHQGKHFLSVMRKRIQLPATIEERIRGSHGSLDSICTGTTTTTTESPTKNSSPLTTEERGDQMELSNGVCIERNQMNGGLENGCTDWLEKTNKEQQSPSKIGKEKSSPSRRNSKQQSLTGNSGRTKGVPQNFGYVKRSNESSTAGIVLSADQQHQFFEQQKDQRTANTSAMPRNDENTQTKTPPNTQYRSFSLTGPGATQLSQSVRERLSNGSHSLPKHGIDMQYFQHRIFNRGGSNKIIDGSLSDTQTYAEAKPDFSTYSLWLKHGGAANRLSDGDTSDTATTTLINFGSPGMQRHKLIHRNGETLMQSPRMNRSSSIRSTKSDKLYSTTLSNQGHDLDSEPFYCLPVGTIQNGRINFGNGTVFAVPWSQPTSPTPLHNRGPMSPTLIGGHRVTYPKKNDEIHGSAASLLSGGSSLYGTTEERHALEVRRLKRELMEARDHVMTLSSQLSTNAHVVAAFEQSLANMTTRLQQLTATAERKDGELTDMRQTIELLRKQSIQAGLTTAHMQSMGTTSPQQSNKLNTSSTNLSPSKHSLNKSNNPPGSPARPNALLHQTGIQRQHSSDSMGSINSISSGYSVQDKKKKKGWLRSSFTKAFSRNAKISKTNNHNSDQNGTSHTNGPMENPGLQNIVRNSNLPPQSPTKQPTSPQKSLTIVENARPVDAIEVDNSTIVEDLKKQLREKDLVLTDIRLEALSSASQLENLKDTVMKMRAEMMTLKQNNDRLQKLVTTRSLAGSDLSLGNSGSPTGSIGESRRYSAVDGSNRPQMELPVSLEEETEDDNAPPGPAPGPPASPLSARTHIDLTPPPPAIEAPSPSHITISNDEIPDQTDGKKISIAVYLGQPESFTKYLNEICEYDNSNGTIRSNSGSKETKENGHVKNENILEDRNFNNPSLNEHVIAYTYISGKTSWQNLDYIVRKTFKDYLTKIDPGTNLGLNTDSITSYHLGEAKRGPEIGFPELLPCGYIIGNVKTLYICLQGVGSLAFDSLIPRSIVHRYITLLTEHRRLILCGPSGTGKSYLARKLAEFLVARSVRTNVSEAIATFNVDHKCSKELRQFLGHIAEQASMPNGASELPSVIILDNLHHASALGDVFSCLLSAGPAANLPCIIGTMSQATCNTTNLQLHHNFRWVLTANHMEPVKGFLARFLRRRVYTLELETQSLQPELSAVLAWLSTVWQHINRFLENHSSSDVTIGPRLFLSCPLDLKDSQVWFTDVWNYHLAPYIVESVREGVQLYGRRGGAWNDPSIFIRDTYPWPYGPDSVAPLRQISADDVGLEGETDGHGNNNNTQDPLLNMLMHLQEAANYSGTQEENEESDCVSLDSNITAESSAGVE